METQIVILEGIEFITPVGFKFPTEFLKDCPSCCGIGTGFLEKLIPDTFWLLRVSPACYVHDRCWDVAKPTWADFHQSNAMFMTNALSMIEHDCSTFKGWILKPLRIYRAALCFSCLTFFGAPLFWAYKRKQMVQAIASNLSSDVRG